MAKFSSSKPSKFTFRPQSRKKLSMQIRRRERRWEQRMEIVHQASAQDWAAWSAANPDFNRDWETATNNHNRWGPGHWGRGSGVVGVWGQGGWGEHDVPDADPHSPDDWGRAWAERGVNVAGPST
ncbi:hypothetical protein C8R43DRAFT_1140477 [Mycena crocata]|nr:hypothetical protein C8R43DRAFT_1140477 [Mycena crocata]